MLAKLCAWLELLLTVMGFEVPPAAEPTCHPPVAQVFLGIGAEYPEQQAGPVGAPQVGFPCQDPSWMEPECLACGWEAGGTWKMDHLKEHLCMTVGKGKHGVFVW